MFSLNSLGFNQAWQKTLEINPSSIWIVLGLRFHFCQSFLTAVFIGVVSAKVNTLYHTPLSESSPVWEDRIGIFPGSNTCEITTTHTEIAIQLTELFRHFYDYKYYVRRFFTLTFRICLLLNLCYSAFSNFFPSFLPRCLSCVWVVNNGSMSVRHTSRRPLWLWIVFSSSHNNVIYGFEGEWFSCLLLQE